MQTKAEFEAKLGETFEVVLEGGVPTLTLAEVAGVTQATREGGGFSAVFEGPADFHLDQGLYRLSSKGAEIDIFLVPIGPFGQGMGFEAVFT